MNEYSRDRLYWQQSLLVKNQTIFKTKKKESKITDIFSMVKIVNVSNLVPIKKPIGYPQSSLTYY